MRKFLCSTAIIFVAGTVAHGLIAAPSIGLVFDRQVFVQEYWRFGVAYVQVTNRTAQETAVTLTTTDGAQAPWKLKAGVSKSFKTPAPKKANENWRVSKDGNSMGVVSAPVDTNIPKEEGFASCV